MLHEIGCRAALFFNVPESRLFIVRFPDKNLQGRVVM